MKLKLVFVGLIGVLVFFIGLFLGNNIMSGIALITALLFFAAHTISIPAYKSYAFTILIFAIIAAAMYFPAFFISYKEFEFKEMIVPLLMLVMFGMGCNLSANDFLLVLKEPKGVIVGLVCMYSVMPVMGFSLAHFSTLPPEIAAGIILVGCSPSGLASNIMAYISKANLALSLTLTAISTLLAPLFTPVLMQKLAGAYLDINILDMFWSISKIVIIPIVAGVIFNKIVKDGGSLVKRIMPIISKGGIIILIAITTSLGRESLLSVGLILIAVVIVHNLFGYTLGYYLARLMKLEKNSARTIAFEVGMQNTGLASGLAVEMGKVATTGLAPALFAHL
ncbi:bile acid:sodium symporter family protein [uncultured Draconibacterium sp.]|uniref:bile acid:sodium symporter family protein n=1 Tax=uncultured Draconibacterium sp. TaxID=1573823 RepID=UPI0029C73435|nr:bile acid:sodium symporter family protein [uncultured Draconibacterium sp.]